MPDVHVLVLQQQRFSKKKKKIPTLECRKQDSLFSYSITFPRFLK